MVCETGRCGSVCAAALVFLAGSLTLSSNLQDVGLWGLKSLQQLRKEGMESQRAVGKLDEAVELKDEPESTQSTTLKAPDSTQMVSTPSSTPAPRCAASMERILLIIHCRNRPEICKRRLPLLDRYSRIFKDVVFLFTHRFEGDVLTSRFHHCSSGDGDPFACVAREVQSHPEARGVLYVQFDMVFAPCLMAQRLETEKLGFVRELPSRYFPFDALDTFGWYYWHGKQTRQKISKLTDDLQKLHLQHLRKNGHIAHEGHLAVLEMLRHGIWKSWSDMFYLPKPAFSIFMTLAKIFRSHQIFHEMAVPTMLAVAAEVAGLEAQSWNCTGNTTQDIHAADILGPDFLCGHRVNYGNPNDLLAAERLLANG